MTMLRIVLGRALIHAGLRCLPPGRARSELYQLIDRWSTHVRRTISDAKRPTLNGVHHD